MSTNLRRLITTEEAFNRTSDIEELKNIIANQGQSVAPPRPPPPGR